MLNLRFRYRFEAAHRFLSSASVPCTTPHGHSWHASLCLRFVGNELNSSGMAVEFSEIKTDWRNLIKGTFDHSYLHNWQDPIVETLKVAQPHCRLIPFPSDPTTELVAVFLFQKMETIIQSGPYSNLIQVDKIIVEETATNHVECGREFFAGEIKNYSDFSGWWLNTDVDDRSFLTSR